MNVKQLLKALALGLLLALLIQPRAVYADGPIPVGPEFQVNTYTTLSQDHPSVAMDADGDFVVAWRSYDQDGDGNGVYAQRYHSDGTPDGAEFQVNTYTTDWQYNPSAAMDADGDFVVAWQDESQDGSAYGVYAQRYTSDGAPDGGEFQVNTYTAYSQHNPSVAMDADGDLIIAWQSDGQGGVYAQRYNSDGTPDGSEFRVNTYITDVGSPSVAMDADGDFVVAWTGWEPCPDPTCPSEVYARRYTSDGAPDGPEFRVNTYTDYDQYGPSVAMDADGDFVVAWTSWEQDGSSAGVYAQRYNSDGTPDGAEFQVNTYITLSQGDPSVAMDADGYFVVAWTSGDQDGDGGGVYAQGYTSDGTPDGAEFQVNTYTTSHQFDPSVAMDADGYFVVAWTSWEQDGDIGVYAQRYATLTLTKTVDDARPEPGQLITFTLTVATSSFVSATHALISDSLPSELNFVGPITLDPPSAGTPGTAPPILASELTISPNTRITLTFPVTVDMGLAKGTVCTNTAAVTSTEVITPRVGVQVVTIGQLSAVFLPVIARNYCSDFFDDFSSPSSGWEVVNDSFVRSEYLSGEYRILSKKAGYFYLFDAPTCKRQNYVVETDAWWVGTPGSGYGLVFGVTPGFNQFYLFDVNTDYQEFRLLRYDPSSGFNTIVSPTTAPAINGGNASNHLKVTRNGNQITLEVNGTVLGTWSDGTITGLTDVGVVSQPYGSRPSSDARFDNFSVTSLPGSSAAAQGLGGAAANGSQLPRTHYAPIPTDIGWRAR